MTGRLDREKLSVTFLQDDMYEVFYHDGEVNYCPKGMEVHSVVMRAGGRSVVYRALVDNLTVPGEAFYAESTEDRLAYEQYVRGLSDYLRYRQDLIDQGHEDLRKP
jgi:hypothetical protein